MNPEVRTDKTPPQRIKYDFGRLKKRGESLFWLGADAHRVRQAAISYQKHHPEIKAAGDKLSTFKETLNKGTENEAVGVGVYRLAIEG